MMRCTSASLRYFAFDKPHERVALQHNPVKRALPLINSGAALPKWRNSWADYSGRSSFDEEDHAQPVVGTKLSEHTKHHNFSAYEQYLNPQLITHHLHLRENPDYVGVRTGKLFPRVGWVPIGGSWKFAWDYDGKRTQTDKEGVWHEKAMTPRWLRAPKVSPGGPRNRYEGKLAYSRVKLSKILWAIDSGKLNPNETITLWHLREAGVIAEQEICWPGVKLTLAGIEKINYPIHLELQRASKNAIEQIEAAGGSFTATFLTADGMYQEMHPEEFPLFPEQNMPHRHALESVATNPKQRGFLSHWYNEEEKYASPDAGRRLSHYVRPPFARDFPATYEEYERVKHHQKWHMNQPGTGTVLPWYTHLGIDLTKKSSGQLS